MRRLLLSLALASSLPTWAQTQVQDAWARATVAGQKATGVYATITSTGGGRLVSATSPVGRVEIHEMAMTGDVMKMRELPDGLALPAGKPVALKPGGHHLMLMDLKQPLATGSTLELTLVVEGADKKRESIAVKAAVRAMGTGGPMGAGGHKP